MGEPRHYQPVTDSVLDALRLLLKQPGSEQSVTNALAGIGTAADVDRVYVFQVKGDTAGAVTASQRFEWTSSGTEPQIDNPDLQEIPMAEAGYGRWMQELRAYRPIVGTVASFPQEEHHLLTAQNIVSLLVLPIYAAGDLWGFIGFDDCTRERDWTPADVDLLITTALAIGNSLAAPGEATVEHTAEIYISLVSRLLEFQTLLFTETPREHLLVRTQTRLRTLAQSYRYFAKCPNAGAVSLPKYLSELRDLYQSIQAVDFEMDSITLPMQRAMDVAVILGEALAVIGDVRNSEFRNARLTVSLRGLNDRVEITLTARSRKGVPLGNGLTPDPMATALFRGMQERFGAQISTVGFDGLLFRVSFRQAG